MRFDRYIESKLVEAVDVHNHMLILTKDIARAARKLCSILKKGGSIYLFGNGGSAADSQHIAAELQGTFYKKRKPLSACALTTNTSTLTAIANDLDYRHTFKRQVESLVKKKDAVIAISTSGKSPNVIEAVKSARKIGAYIVGFTGAKGQRFSRMCDISLEVPSENVARIQECHILIGHIICELIEKRLT